MKLTVDVSGNKQVKAMFDKFGEEGALRLTQLTEITSQDIERDAKRLAPVDLGALKLNIAWQRPINKVKGLIRNIITAYMPYSAYQEFGTGGDVDIPPGWEKLAVKFKGSGKRVMVSRAR
jgi:hypothetical protein